MHLLFSYGSNNIKQLTERVGRVDPPLQAVRATLRGHMRIFAGHSSRWGGGPASVIPRPSSVVAGTIVQLTEDELQKLDSFEIGYTRTQKDVCLCSLPGVSLPAHIYVKDDHAHHSLPSLEYLQAIHRNIEESCIPIYVLPSGTGGPVLLAALWELEKGITVVRAIGDDDKDKEEIVEI